MVGVPFGLNDRGYKAQVRNLLRTDIHEGASVKAGARRDRDFPNIHSASPASAGRHETLCGCSHSHRRRRTAPCRSPGCNLSPALDLDSDAVLLPRTGPPGCSSHPEAMPLGRPLDPFPLVAEASGGPGGSGPKPALPSPQASGPQAPPGPPDACPPATRGPRPNPLPSVYPTDRGPLHSFTPTHPVVLSGGATPRRETRAGRRPPRPGIVPIEAGASTCVPGGQNGSRVAVPIPSPDCTAVTLAP